MATKVVLALLAVAAFLAVTGTLAVSAVAMFMRAWRRAQAKGYTGPVAAAALMTTGMASLLGGMFLWIVLSQPADSTVTTFVGTCVGFAAAAVGPALVVQLMPARPVRSGGRRRPRTPFRVLGNVAAALPPVALIALMVNGLPTKVALQLMLPMAVVSSLCESAGRRAGRIDAPPPPIDPRPAVVWIRGFGNERRFFGFRRRHWQEPGLLPELRWIFRRRKEPVSFEDYFAPVIAEELGRGYGLGNPRDYLPPEGLDRHYATDDSWRDQFAELVAGARCVIMAPGDWPELRYEFRVIRKLGAHRRLFVFTPPAGKARQIRWANWIRGFPHETWEDFKAALGDKSGYRLGRAPGPGAVVTFKQDGRAVALAYDAEEPADYITAVLRHLDDI